MKEKISIISVLANTFLAGGKIMVGFLTGSSAVLAEGFHSGMDIFSSVISFIGIKTSQKPVDEKHPYGHYKFEVLAGLIITIILFVTGFLIVLNSYENIKNPSYLNISYLALGIMLVAAIINEIMARLKIYYGKKENSISLLSDGVHSRVDVYASLAVLLGLLFTKYWIYTDAVLALMVGLYIIKESFSIGREAVDSLLDVSAGEEIERKIKSIVKDQNIEIESLKTQKKGSAVTANLEIKLSKDLKIEQATKISNDLKNKLINSIESLQYVAIQIISHEISQSFYKPSFGHVFGWQGKIEGASGKGPQGNCICSNCGYKVEHKRGTPCFEMVCPKCDINLKRE